MKRFLYFLICVVLFAGCNPDNADPTDNGGGGNGGGGDGGKPALYAVAYGNGRWVAVGAGGTILYSDDGSAVANNYEGDDMGQLVHKRYTLHMIDRYAGTNFEAACDARGDTDMNQVPNMIWLLTMVDRMNGYATNYRTSEYATQLALTNDVVNEVTKTLIRTGNVVAVGASGKMADSTFGTSHIHAIAYDGGKFVAVGASGKMAYSADGVSWTAVSNSTFGSNYIRGIAYGGGKFVAVGYNGKAAYSTDGITWTAVTDTKFDSDNILGIAYGGGKFVIGGSFSQMAYSSDGINWTAITNSTFGTNPVSHIIYSNNKFMAISINYSNRIMYSADGINWTTTTNSIFEAVIYGIAYGGGKFVAVGDSGKMAYSADGVSWTAVADSTFGSNYINGIASKV